MKNKELSDRDIPKDLLDYRETHRRRHFKRLVKIVRFHRMMERWASSFMSRILAVVYPIPWERK